MQLTFFLLYQFAVNFVVSREYTVTFTIANQQAFVTVPVAVVLWRFHGGNQRTGAIEQQPHTHVVVGRGLPVLGEGPRRQLHLDERELGLHPLGAASPFGVDEHPLPIPPEPCAKINGVRESRCPFRVTPKEKSAMAWTESSSQRQGTSGGDGAWGTAVC